MWGWTGDFSYLSSLDMSETSGGRQDGKARISFKTKSGNVVTIEVLEGDTIDLDKIQEVRDESTSHEFLGGASACGQCKCGDFEKETTVETVNIYSSRAEIPASHTEQIAISHVENNQKLNVEQPDKQPEEEVEPNPDHEALEPDVAATPKATVLQFDSAAYYCSEEESMMVINVMRIGDLSRVSEVQCQTRDGSAKAGAKFVHTSENLIFQTGENLKQFQIPLVNDDKWDSTLEFSVELQQDGLVNGILGRYLWRASVSIIDNDVFPTNRYKDELLEQNWETLVPPSGLLREYLKLTFANPVVRKGSIKIILADLFRTLYLVLGFITMKIYLVDKVLKPKGSVSRSNREATLIVLVVITWVPFFIIHALDYYQHTWKVGGGSRAMIQANLLRKFLNYSQESRASLVPGDLIMAITRDTTELVHSGYIKALDLLACGGQLLCVITFQMILSVELGLAALIVFPMVLLAAMKCRAGVTAKTLHQRNLTQIDLIDHVVKCVNCYQLIADYNLRSQVIDDYEVKIKKYNAALVEASLVLCNNKYVAKHLCMVFVAVYTVYGAVLLMENPNTYTLGDFLAKIAALKSVGETWSEIYGTLNAMQTVTPSLFRIVSLMNKPTDVAQRMAFNRKRRAHTMELREKMFQAGQTGNLVDKLDIIVENFKFSPFLKGPGSSLHIQQGKLVCLVGPHSQGKSFLLNYISNSILPESDHDGLLFIPSHLRVLHISADPLFYPGTLRDNLTIGVGEGDEDGRPERVLEICTMLGLKDRVLSHMDMVEQDWRSKFSAAEIQLINVARALVANAEILCIHKPTAVFNDILANNVMKALRQYIVQKGVCQNPSTTHLRRPRTCVFTAVRPTVVDYADDIIYVDRRGARKIHKGELKDLEADMHTFIEWSTSVTDFQSSTAGPLEPFEDASEEAFILECEDDDSHNFPVNPTIHRKPNIQLHVQASNGAEAPEGPGPFVEKL